MAKELIFPPAQQQVRQLLYDTVEKKGLQISAGLGSDYKIPLKDLFFNLILLTEDGLEKLLRSESFFSSVSERGRQLEQFKSRLEEESEVAGEAGIELADLFSISEDATESGQGTCSARNQTSDAAIKNVLVFGSAGSGKSTIFLTILEYLWAKGSLWKGRIDLVLALALRRPDVQTANSLFDLLTRRFASLNVSAEVLSEICRYFCHLPYRLCIVVDGLDECSLDKCSDYMRALLMREIDTDVHVVVTSRPCTDAYKLSKCGQYQRQVEARGFSAENVETYVRNVMGSVRAEVMLEELRSKPDILSLMGTPLFAAMACELFRSRHGLAESSTAWYESLLLRVFERRAAVAYESFNAVEEADLEVMSELSRFALAMLSVQKVVISEADVKSAQLSDAAIQLGLLAACEDYGAIESRQYRFAHLSLQEFLPAWYLSREVLKNEQDAAWLVKRVGHYSGHMTLFWRFLITLLPRAVSIAVMENLWLLIYESYPWARSDTVDSRLAADIASYAYCKAERSELCKMQSALCGLLKYKRLGQLADKLLEETHGEGNGCRCVESAVPSATYLSNEVFLTTLISLWRQQAREPSDEAFLAAVHSVDPVTAARCRNAMRLRPRQSVSSSSCETIAYASPALRPAYSSDQRLCLVHFLVAHHQHCGYHGGSCDGCCSFFSPVFADGFSLIGVDLYLFECASIAYCLSTHSCISTRVIDLYGCHTGIAGLRCIRDGVLSCKNVRLLDVTSNSCSDASTLCAIILSLSATLEEVNVRKNRVVGCGGVAAVYHAVSSCEKLSVADVSGLAGDGGAVELACISGIVQACSLLRNLYAFSSLLQFDDECLEKFVRAVKRHGAIRKLCFHSRLGENQRVVAELKQLVSDEDCTLQAV